MVDGHVSLTAVASLLPSGCCLWFPPCPCTSPFLAASTETAAGPLRARAARAGGQGGPDSLQEDGGRAAQLLGLAEAVLCPRRRRGQGARSPGLRLEAGG